MPIVTEQLPNLMNGVSQQAVTMRMTSQCTEQINGFSSIVEGVNKRPPSKTVAELITGDAGDVHIHTIDRSPTEKYTAIILDGDIRVFDMEGNEQTVNAPGGMAYLNANSPRTDFRALTVNESTFIVNRNVNVETDDLRSDPREDKTLVFISGVNYGVRYDLKVRGEIVATFNSPSSDNAPKISTEIVATSLFQQLSGTSPTIIAYRNPNNGDIWGTYNPVDDIWTGFNFGTPVYAPDPNDSPLSDDYRFVLDNNLIEITYNGTGQSDRFEISDDFSDSYSDIIDNKTRNVSDLPLTAPNGFITQVTGDPSSPLDNYYLRFETKDGSNGIAEGQWVETVSPNTKIRLDRSTMPHVLRREANGTFTFEEAVWADRAAGNTISNPWPSFVSSTINDVYLDRNRLCFLSGPNDIMSRSRALFEFFRPTMTTVLDDDPIDVTASGATLSELHSALTFNKQVLLFSDQAQFTITDNDLLATQPPSIRLATEYEADKEVSPVGVGRTVFFTTTRGQYTSVMEYYVLDDTEEVTDASDVAKHVPTYIPSGTFKLAASPTADIVVALSAEEQNTLYVYKYYWQGNEKRQSSWSKWEFKEGGEILNVDFVKDIMIKIVQYGGGIYLETIDCSEGQTDPGIDFVFRLDRRVDQSQVTRSYNAPLDQTTITLPYRSNVNKVTMVITEGGTGNLKVASAVQVLSVDGFDIVVQGDMRDENYYIGEPYEFRYEFSEPMIKTQAQGGGMAAITAGRLQIHKWYVSFSNTGYFRAEVTNGGQTYKYAYSGKILGTASANIGVPSFSSGTFGFRVNGRSRNVKVSLINDSYLPSYFTAAEWEGRYERRTAG